jgi:CelD/BcsL family acetyltransferase involved in cellulose biosynthesis
MSNNWKFRIYRSWEEVDDPSFLSRCEVLLNDSVNAHIFFHPVLLKSWTDTYRNLCDITPAYCFAESNDKTAFLPLVLIKRNWKHGFVRLLVPVGYSDFDYHDPVLTGQWDSADLQCFWKLLEENISAADSSINFDKIAINGCREPNFSSSFYKESDCSHYCDLTKYDSYEEFLKNIKKSLRGDLMRQQRRLEELGNVDFVVYKKSNPDKALAELHHLLDAHTARWPNAYKAPALHNTLLKNGLPAGLVHFSAIKVNGISVSWHLGFTYKYRFYYYLPSFLESHANYSTSKVHLARLFADSFNNGIEIFDMLRGDELYKKSWSNADSMLYAFTKEQKRPDNFIRLNYYHLIQKIKS